MTLLQMLGRWLYPKAAEIKAERDALKAKVAEWAALVKTLQSENITLAATVDRLTRQLNAAIAELAQARGQ